MQSSQQFSPVRTRIISQPQPVLQMTNSRVLLQEEVVDPVQLDNSFRVRYLRKLYFLLLLQLSVATWFTYIAEVNENFEKWVLRNYGFTFYTCLVGLILVYLSFLLRRKSVASFPFNWLLYLLHVIFFSFLVAYWETNRKDKDQYLHNSLFYATVVVLSLWVHYLTVRSQLTFQSSTLFVIGVVFLKTVLLYVYDENVRLDYTYFLALQSVVWGFYLVWETETSFTQVKDEFSREDYITGSFGVYLYVLYVFLGVAQQLRLLLVKARV